jgi:hypothetical protein
VSNVLGVLAFLLYIVAVIAVAAAVSWVVVKVSPAKKPDSEPQA